jgi:uncharacterized HhH-GPD family protein
MTEKQITEILIKRGNELLLEPYTKIEFTGVPESDTLLNDIKRLPHAFILSCVMDRQISAERAWLIPYKIFKELGSFEFEKLAKIDLKTYRDMFKNNNLHRFNDIMSKNFYSAVQKIKNEYGGDASKIWSDNPKSATIVRRMLEFQGVGVKIATMTANILARQFKIQVQDHICIDISPDVHIKRVFHRLGFVSKEASVDELIYRARELNPEYPGIFDFSCWEIGRNWCRPKKPECEKCYMKECCPKAGAKE